MDGPVGIMFVRGSATVVAGSEDPTPGVDESPAHEAESLVWLEDGEERPFSALPERRRPWLEESATWGEGSRDARPADEGPEPPDTLVWL